jgi:putative transposase
MPNTYTQLNLHYIFAVKFRNAVISPSWETELYKFITTIFQDNGHKIIQLNGVADHIHILAGLNASQSISLTIQKVKSESSKWVNSKRFLPSKFAWQEGYAAFTYSKSQLPEVIRYIQNQKLHHEKQTFIEEYMRFLTAFEVPFEEKYIFNELM